VLGGNRCHKPQREPVFVRDLQKLSIRKMSDEARRQYLFAGAFFQLFLLIRMLTDKSHDH
jgi:hypothetical protein